MSILFLIFLNIILGYLKKNGFKGVFSPIQRGRHRNRLFVRFTAFRFYRPDFWPTTHKVEKTPCIIAGRRYSDTARSYFAVSGVTASVPEAWGLSSTGLAATLVVGGSASPVSEAKPSGREMSDSSPAKNSSLIFCSRSNNS